MDLGYELIRDQIFFRKELVERARWFISLRWLAGGLGLLAGWVVHIFWQALPILPLSIIACIVICYNFIFLFVWKRLRLRGETDAGPFVIFSHIQISVDLFFLFLAIYFTGGISSPLLYFVIFHIILAGILLSAFSCFVYGILSVMSTGLLMVFQYIGAVPLFSSPRFRDASFLNSMEWPDVVVPMLAFAASIIVAAYLVTTIRESLRKKGRDLLRVSKELDETNTKLKALYEMVKELGLCTDLQNLMDSATRNAARIMGVKGCSIKLLDEKRQTLRFASTYGLSQDYVAKGSIDIEKSPINQNIIQGSVFSIGKINEKEYFEYPEDVEREGISSLVCLPLRVEKMVLGVFCVYSDTSYYFSDNDVTFFSLMADLTALAIENLKSETNKTWFLHKASHQLRSPLNAIHTMLTVLEKGYQGDLNEKQKEIIQRCVNRLQILGEMLGDLLKLGIRRITEGEKALPPIDIVKILQTVSDVYRPRASEKGLDILCIIDEKIPRVRWDEKMLDDLFSNLISNAIKYTLPGGKIKIHLTRKGKSGLRFVVSDNGIGIPQDDIPRLFTEFFRAENAKQLMDEGTGLGLAIVKEVVDHLKGTITVKSKTGEGSTFTCIIPIS